MRSQKGMGSQVLYHTVPTNPRNEVLDGAIHSEDTEDDWDTDLDDHGVYLVWAELELVSGEGVCQPQLHRGHLLVWQACKNKDLSKFYFNIQNLRVKEYNIVRVILE